MDATRGVITGHPYGGVGFLWNKSLDASISVIESDYDWLCCIEICHDKKEYFLINVCLPFESYENRDNFKDCLAKLNFVKYQQYLYYWCGGLQYYPC